MRVRLLALAGVIALAALPVLSLSGQRAALLPDTAPCVTVTSVTPPEPSPPLTSTTSPSPLPTPTPIVPGFPRTVTATARPVEAIGSLRVLVPSVRVRSAPSTTAAVLGRRTYNAIVPVYEIRQIGPDRWACIHMIARQWTSGSVWGWRWVCDQWLGALVAGAQNAVIDVQTEP